MRNKSFKFILSALLTVTLLLSCFSMLAQAATVSSVTAYHADSDEVVVSADVSGLSSNSMVSYIVTEGTPVNGALTDSHILYIDEADLTSASTATFTYKFDKSKLNGQVETVVKVGSDTDTFTENPTDLGLVRISEDFPRGIKVTYSLDKDGSFDAMDNVDDNSTDLYATIDFEEGYRSLEIEKVYIDGELEYEKGKYGVYQSTYKVTKSIKITVTKATLTTGISSAEKITFIDRQTYKRSYGYIMQRRGNHPDLAEMGIKYNDYLYPALKVSVEDNPISPGNDNNLAQPYEDEYVIVVLQFGGTGAASVANDNGNLNGTPDLATLDREVIPYYMVYTDDTRTTKDPNVYDQEDHAFYTFSE